MAKPLRCCNCGKLIAEDVQIKDGTVKIACKCGTVNTVEAEQKVSVPYGERQQIQTKDLSDVARPYIAAHLMSSLAEEEKAIIGECGGPELKLKGGAWGGEPINTSINAKS